jgi:hypothetical protein
MPGGPAAHVVPCLTAVRGAQDLAVVAGGDHDRATPETVHRSVLVPDTTVAQVTPASADRRIVPSGPTAITVLPLPHTPSRSDHPSSWSTMYPGLSTIGGAHDPRGRADTDHGGARAPEIQDIPEHIVRIDHLRPGLATVHGTQERVHAPRRQHRATRPSNYPDISFRPALDPAPAHAAVRRAQDRTCRPHGQHRAAATPDAEQDLRGAARHLAPALAAVRRTQDECRPRPTATMTPAPSPHTSISHTAVPPLRVTHRSSASSAGRLVWISTVNWNTSAPLSSNCHSFHPECSPDGRIPSVEFSSRFPVPPYWWYGWSVPVKVPVPSGFSRPSPRWSDPYGRRSECRRVTACPRRSWPSPGW